MSKYLQAKQKALNKQKENEKLNVNSINQTETENTNNIDFTLQDKKLVAFYGRVSNDEEEMLRSMGNQKDMFKDWIKQNGNWELYETYTDEGATGLNLSKRYAFKRMLNDAKQGKFQILMIKSVSRFGRNITDTSGALDLLLSLKIRVIFVEDRIDSDNPSDLQKFGLFSWLAEMESRKISERINLTFDKMQKEGYYLGSKAPFGYTKKQGKLFINHIEAEVVKRIFNLYLENGYGSHKICQTLDNEKIETPSRADFWSEAQIKRILTNPAYLGNTYTKQSKTFDVKQRTREFKSFDEWLLFENTHEAIISQDVFEKAEKEMFDRRIIHETHSRQSSVHLLSNLIKCGRCGSSYRRKRQDKHIVWTCTNYERNGKTRCTSERFKEKNILTYLKELFLKLKHNKEYLIKTAKETKKSEKINENNLKLKLKDLENEKEKIHKKLNKLLELYTDDLIDKKQYLERSKPLNDTIDNIQLNINKIQENLSQQENADEQLTELLNELDELIDEKNWTNSILKKHIYKIIIYDKKTFEVILHLQKQSYELDNFNNSETTYLPNSTVVGVWKGVENTKSLDFQCMQCQSTLVSSTNFNLKIDDVPMKIFNTEDDKQIKLSILISKKDLDIKQELNKIEVQ